MKKNFKIVVTVLMCLAMMALFAACGGKEGDKAYTNWTETQLPKITQASGDFQAKVAEANGDRDAIISATMDFKAVIEAVTNELAAIDTSTMSDNVKSAAEQQLAQLQGELQTLNDSLSNAGVSDVGQQEAPVDGGEEAPVDEEYFEEE